MYRGNAQISSTRCRMQTNAYYTDSLIQNISCLQNLLLPNQFITDLQSLSQWACPLKWGTKSPASLVCNPESWHLSSHTNAWPQVLQKYAQLQNHQTRPKDKTKKATSGARKVEGKRVWQLNKLCGFSLGGGGMDGNWKEENTKIWAAMEWDPKACFLVQWEQEQI